MSYFRAIRGLLPAVLLALTCFNAGAANMFFGYAELPPTQIPPLLPNMPTASVSAIINGATNSATASLATGKIGVLEAGVGGSVPSGVFQSIAQLGDTITATGSASGLSGLNLGLNITVNGTTMLTDPSQNFSFLWVYMLKPGSFDQTTFTALPNIFFARGYELGQGTNFLAPSLFQSNNVPITAVFGDGTNTIPLTIPFSAIGSNFQIEVVLGSAEVVTTPSASWTADFSHTATVSLVAPPGVTLSSASGLLPGTGPATIPEPGSLLLVCGGIVALGARKLWPQVNRRLTIAMFRSR